MRLRTITTALLCAAVFFVFFTPVASAADCFLWVFCAPESSTPPPAPAPTITAVCDGKRPDRGYGFELQQTCTDVHTLHLGELVTIEGYNFRPGFFSIETVLRTPDGTLHATAPHPYPRGVNVLTGNDGRFTVIIQLPPYANPNTIPPGQYPLTVKTAGGHNQYDTAAVHLTIVAKPTPPPQPLPQKPTPQPTPPTPTPTPSPTAATIVHLILKNVQTGTSVYFEPRFVPPLLPAGTVVDGYPFRLTFTNFPDSTTEFELLIDGKSVRKNVSTHREATVELSGQETTLGLGNHAIRVHCTASCSQFSYDSQFILPVVAQPPGPTVEFPQKRTIQTGDTIIISGKNFIPGHTITSIVFQKVSAQGFLEGRSDAKAVGTITVDQNTAWRGTFGIPAETAALLGGTSGTIVATQVGEVDEYKISADDYLPKNQWGLFTLTAPCTLAGEPTLEASTPTIDLTQDDIAISLQAKGFFCNDAFHAAVTLGSTTHQTALTLTATENQKQFDYTGTLQFTLLGEKLAEKLDPTTTEATVTVVDDHNRSASKTFKIFQKYFIELSSTRLKPGEEFTITAWRGFDANTKVDVYFDERKLGSVYLNKEDPHPLAIPKNAVNGPHMIKISRWWGFGRTAEVPIELYGSRDVIEPTLSVSPIAVVAGGSLSVRGENWSSGERNVALFTHDGKTFPLTTVQDVCPKTLGGRGCGEGEIGYAVVIPEYIVSGDYFLGVFSAAGEKASSPLRIFAAKKIVSNKAHIVIEPTSGVAGTTVLVSGSGFSPRSGLSMNFDKEKLVVGRGFGLDTDENGSFTTLITVPLNAPAGTHVISATTGAFSSRAAAEFLVLAPSAPKPQPEQKTPTLESSTAPVVQPTPEPAKKIPAEPPQNIDTRPSPYPSGIPTGIYGQTTTPSYGDINTKPYGDIKTNSYGEVKTNSYGNGETKQYNGVQAPSYGDVQTKQYGDIPAPSYEAPSSTPSGCNPLVPLYNQPAECRKLYFNNHAKPFHLGSIWSIFARLFGFGKNTAPNPVPSSPSPLPQKLSPQSQTLPIPAERHMQYSQPKPPAQNNPSQPTTSASKSKQTETPPVSQLKPSATSFSKTPRPDLAGSYRCFSYNVSGGGGGNCRLFSPIVLAADGSYTVSSESGVYKVDADSITLSESKLRGVGRLLENGMQIRFEYDYNGWHHTVTYLRESTAAPEKSAAVESPVQYIELTLRVTFPEGDRSADNVNSLTLINKDTGAQVAQALPYPVDAQTIEAWFSKRPPKEGVAVGHVYTVLVGSGFGDWMVGEVNLRDATKDMSLTITALPQR